MSKPVLSIIIVSYNVREFLYQTINSVQRSLQGISSEIIVVDNASWDGSAAMVQKDFPEVNLISNTTNVGFAKANNLAIDESQGEYLIFLNPDTIVQEDTFQTLLDFFSQHPKAGVVGCKILNPDGSLQLSCRRSIPTPWVGFTKLVGLSKLFPKSKLFGKYNLTYLNPDEITEVEAISGSFMMTSRTIINHVGRFDDRFFMYGEDLDLCHRVYNAGWKIYYVPTTQIIHYKGSSSTEAQFDTLLQFYRAMLLFVRKHFKAKYFLFPQWVLVLGIGLRGFMSFVHNLFLKFKWSFVDLFFLNFSLMIAIYLRFGSLVHWQAYLMVTLIYSSVWLTVFYFFELSNIRKFSVANAVGAVLLGLVLNSAITFFAKSFAFSRIVVLLAGILNLFFIPGWRWAIYRLAKKSRSPLFDRIRNSVIERRTMIVGDGSSLSNLVKKLKESHLTDSKIVALLLTDSNVYNLNGAATLPLFFDIDHLPRHIRELEVNEVVFSPDSLAYEKIFSLISQSQDLGVDFRIASNDMGVLIGAESLERLEGISLVEIRYRLLRPSYRFLKRLVDWTFALPILLVSIPAWPILFLQGNRLRKIPIFTRIGENDLDPQDFSLQQDTINLKTPKKVFVFCKKNRLPKSRLQMVPILFYVLKGDLTLIGSEFQFEMEQLTSINTRINLKPGLISIYEMGKDQQTSLEHEEKLAVQYLKNYSPMLDLEILFRSTSKRKLE